jgi:hypothetical protein
MSFASQPIGKAAQDFYGPTPLLRVCNTDAATVEFLTLS